MLALLCSILFLDGSLPQPAPQCMKGQVYNRVGISDYAFEVSFGCGRQCPLEASTGLSCQCRGRCPSTPPPPSPFHTSLQAPALLRGYIFGNIEFSSAQRSKNISSLGGDTVNDRPLSQAKIVTTKVV